MSMDLLCRKIISIAEQKMVNLRGLRGLKIRELRKFARSLDQSDRSIAGENPVSAFERSLDIIDKHPKHHIQLSASGHNFRGEDINQSNRQLFWDSYCRRIPGDGKVGDYINEN